MDTGSVILLILIALYLIYIAIRVYDFCKKRSFDRRIKRMIAVMHDRLGEIGVIECPTVDGPFAIDGSSGMKQYVFLEYSKDGKERAIYVSEDCSDVDAYQWTMRRNIVS